MEIVILVESFSKIKTIQKLLDNTVSVEATGGHICNLPSKQLGIDVNNNFKPTYELLSCKSKVISNLKNKTKGKEVYFAGDPDREGEAICYHAANLLKIPPNKAKRVLFNEITKKALTNAIKKENIGTIDINLFYAQQARVILDRLIGYLVSPIIQKHTNIRTSSAGRVQSVVLKVVCEKEEEIKEATIGASYVIQYKLYKTDKKELYEFKLDKNLEQKEQVLQLFEKSKNVTFKIFKIIDTHEKRNPMPPFITSSLQQTAYSKLSFSVKKTMDIAQKLYMSGKITYLRTDSTTLSSSILPIIKKYIVETYGEEYSQVRSWNLKKGKNAQEAHEAIRPTNINFKYDKLSCPDEQKLYKLIYERTVASQMAAAEFDIKTIHANIGDILPKVYYLICKIEQITFEGHLRLYKEQNTTKKPINLKENDILNFYNCNAAQKYNNPSSRYNEGTMVKKMEDLGIGRPSTYTTCVNSVLKRNYCEVHNIPGIEKEVTTISMNIKYTLNEKNSKQVIGKETRKIIPTELGIHVNNFINKNFNNIINFKFTFDMENYLDDIASGNKKWLDVISMFYQELKPKIDSIKIDNTNCLAKVKKEHETKLLGEYKKENIYISKGKYGYTIHKNEIGSKNCKFYAIPKGINNNTIDLDKSIFLMNFPHTIGTIDKKELQLCIGKFGYYAKYDKKNINLKKYKIEIEHYKIPDISLFEGI